MDHVWLVKQVYNFYIAALVGIISRHDIRIEAHHINQPNKTNLGMYKPLLAL